MKTYKFLFLSMVFIFLSQSCTEKYDIKLKGEEHRLVIEAVITDEPGPYFVRLTKSRTSPYSEPNYSADDRAEPVKNALIIISDNIGNVDTLIPVKEDDSTGYSYAKGYYKTTNIQGVAGRTYYLYIKSEEKEYNSESYMPTVTSIDSIAWIFKKGEVGKYDGYTTIMYFKDPPNEKNYYMTYDSYYFLYTYKYSDSWPFILLDDEFLKSGVNEIDLSNKPSISGKIIYGILRPLNEIINSMGSMDTIPSPIVLASLTEEAYEFQSNLIRQFKNDGGAYSPTPSSPTTNISNGALGFFRASSISNFWITKEYLLSHYPGHK